MNQYNEHQLKYSGYSPTTDPILIGMGETEGNNSPASTEEDNENNFDAEAWGNGIGSVLGGVGDLLGSLGVGNNNALPASSSNLPKAQEEPTTKKPSTMLWLIILGVLITLIIVFMMMRKAKSTD